MTAKEFETLKREQFENQLSQLIMWFKIGEADCRSGVYDKYYRYHSNEACEAYDAGWMNQNKKSKNDSVKFIEITF